MIDPRHVAPTPESVGLDSALVDALLERAGKEVREGVLPSAQIAIARNGKIAAMRSFGRVLHHGVEAPATDETLYCVFSSTKAITSAAAWLLIQDGALDVGERVADLIPEFGDERQGRGHRRAALHAHRGLPAGAVRPQRASSTASKRLRALRAAGGSTGSRASASSTTRRRRMYVIAELIERLSGASYGDFVRKRIAEPLGLADLWVGLPRALHGRLADCEHVGEALTDEDYRALGIPEAARHRGHRGGDRRASTTPTCASRAFPAAAAR